MSEIWTVNRGSSTLKVGRFHALSGAPIERLTLSPDAPLPTGPVRAIGHRVVHGGSQFKAPTLITPEVLAALEALVPLAPLHQPASLATIRACLELNVPQFACFDTAFHTTQDPLVSTLALPELLRAGGVQNYGFHGLNYQHVSEVLGNTSGRRVVLHLGSGASACALQDGQSRGSSMGFSALEGLIMGTRPGRLDPGVVLHWLKAGMSVEALEKQLYHGSGLKGLAGSGDMRSLLARDDDAAQFAVEAFCLSAARAVGDLSVVLGGLDGVVFTGGVGENAKEIRARIMQRIRHLTTDHCVIAADEEGVIARSVLNQLS